MNGQVWQAQAVIVRPSAGEIFIGGYFSKPNDAHVNFAVARFNSTGVLDGIQTIIPTTGYLNEVWAMAV